VTAAQSMNNTLNALVLAALLLCGLSGCWQGANPNTGANSNPICAEGLTAKRDEHGAWGCYKRTSALSPSPTLEQIEDSQLTPNGTSEQDLEKAHRHSFIESNFDPSQVDSWIKNGILWGGEALSWKKNGFSDPAVAGKWHELIRTGVDGRWDSEGLEGTWSDSAPVARAYVQAGLTIQEVTTFKHEGINVRDSEETLIVADLMKHGYNFQRARYYAEHHVPLDNIKSYERAEHTLTTVCHGKAYNEFELLNASPYATKDHCYVISFGEVSQWLGPQNALIGGRLLVEFRSPPSSNSIQDLLVEGVGAYTYTSVTGAYMTVPHVLVLHQLSGTMAYRLPGK
jgi:hypothetical protein